MGRHGNREKLEIFDSDLTYRNTQRKNQYFNFNQTNELNIQAKQTALNDMRNSGFGLRVKGNQNLLCLYNPKTISQLIINIETVSLDEVKEESIINQIVSDKHIINSTLHYNEFKKLFIDKGELKNKQK